MKKLRDLTVEELKIVFDKNEKLKNEVFNESVEDVGYYISDIMSTFRDSADWCFSVDQYDDFINVKNRALFIHYFTMAQKMFCILNPHDESILDKTYNLIDHFIDIADDLSDLNYERMYDRIGELVSYLTHTLYKFIRHEYDSCFDEDYQVDYFTGIYLDNHIDDSYYIDDDYKLWQHVEYEKCYA